MNLPNRYGIIDLGTNTFHLLIVDKENDSFKTISRERVYVKLGQGGVSFIQKVAFDRGLETLIHFNSILQKFNCINFKCVGTAALRKSTNAQDFISTVKKEIGFDIEVISGQQEATYIYNGISKVFSFQEAYSLVMDIGGGSVEFIIANKNGIAYSESIPMGIAILKHSFHHSNPISDEEKEELNKFYFEHTTNFRAALDRYNPTDLIGSSGTFDVLNDRLKKEIINPAVSKIDLPSYHKFANKTITSSLEELKGGQAIPDERLDLISVAFQLINLTIKASKIQNLYSSKHALKEGLLNAIAV